MTTGPSYSRSGAASGRQRLMAWTGAALLHGLMLLTVLGMGAAGLPVGGQIALREGEATEVTLSGWEGVLGRGAAKPEPVETAEQRLDRIVDRLRVANSDLFAVEKPTVPRAQGGLSSLFAPVKGSGAGAAGQGNSNGGIAPESGSASAQRASARVGEAGAKGGSLGTLWRQIEVCWKRLPQTSAVPVTLEISLTADGRLAKPPRILRPDPRAPSEERLVSEARALEAISACLPYADTQGLGQVQKVVFPGRRS